MIAIGKQLQDNRRSLSPKVIVRRFALVAISALVAITQVGCGRYQGPSGSPDVRPTNSTLPSGITVTRCKDVPPVPQDQDVSVGRSADDDPVHTVTFSWTDKSIPEPELVQYTVRIGDPGCDKRSDILARLDPGEPPQFETARIFVRDGEDRAYVGYTIIGHGGNQYASPVTIRAVGDDGRAVDWKHQTATGGPADVVAMEGRRVVAPGTRDGGDADYFDASAVRVGETVTVTFTFESGEVDVPFLVVQAD